MTETTDELKHDQAEIGKIPPASDDVKRNNEPLSLRLDHFSRIAISILGTLYAVGLLIVNSNLGQHGLFHAELARPEYVMAGAMWAFLTGLTLVVIRATTLELKDYFTASKWSKSVTKAILLIVISTYGYFAALQFVSIGKLYVIEELDWSVNWEGVFGVAALILNALLPWSAVQIIRSWSKAGTRTITDFSKGILTWHHWSILWNLALGLTTLSTYATSTYPLLPRQFGGGSKPFVRILFSESYPSFELMGDLPVSADRKSVGPARLIFETDKMLFLKAGYHQTLFGGFFERKEAKESRLIGIERSRIVTLIYLSR